eukprot:TRINITY_DN12588_c0_g1_i1.p1 TRINITY_DN12588_c0_g1~~TRINITY_DN12588_c0_g1_i1.p1  ORF type:complete len:317 (-),score=22.09 TRINITY_DN12588_c0_g1_i1:26-976(-)
MGWKNAFRFAFNIIFSIALWIKWGGEMLIRLIGPLFVLTAWTLLSSTVYIFFTVILPYHVETIWSVAGLFHLCIDIFLMQGVFFNYFMCVFTPAGTSPEPSDEDMEKIHQLENEPAPERGRGFSKFCRPCRALKPRRSHHCHVCGRCVLKMDHHCPWVSNCVGHYNHRYFFLFLFYMTIGAVYIALMTVGPFRDPFAKFNVPLQGISARGIIIFLFVMSVALFIAVSLMMVWHLYLILTSQTTIEFYFNKWKASEARDRGETYRNPYDLGYKKNWEYFFGKGKYWFSWMLPDWNSPPGNGVQYPTISSSGSEGSMV